MGAKATTIEEQIEILRQRGMIIHNVEKTKEILLDVGYYRLGFYWFPFETSYPELDHRQHQFKPNTHVEDAVRLYYFDFNLRNLMHKILCRIEIAVKTYMTYIVSNTYKEQPTWFVDPSIVSKAHVLSFDQKVYTKNFRRISQIAHHHRMHINEKYAPAWKTIEYMTMGATITLYKSLRDNSLKTQVAKRFGINFPVVFENYMNVLRSLRNACAHSNVLYDFSPEKSIRKGPAMYNDIGQNQNLNGAIHVALYIIRHISENRYLEYCNEIQKLIDKQRQYSEVNRILTDISGFSAQLQFCK